MENLIQNDTTLSMHARECFQTLMSLHHAQIVNDSEGNVKSHLSFLASRRQQKSLAEARHGGFFISCVMLNILIVIKNALRCHPCIHKHGPRTPKSQQGTLVVTNHVALPPVEPCWDARRRREETVSALLANMSRWLLCC